MKRRRAEQSFAGSGNRRRGTIAPRSLPRSPSASGPSMEAAQAAAGLVAATGARVLAVVRRGFCAGTLCDRRGGLRSSVPRGAAPALCWLPAARASRGRGRRGAPAGRRHRYSHRGPVRRRNHRGGALVLSPAGRSGHQPRHAPVVPAAGPGDARGLRGRACGCTGSADRSRIARRAHHGARAIARPSSDAQTIRPDARLLFVAGAGWTKKQPDGQTHVAEAGER